MPERVEHVAPGSTPFVLPSVPVEARRAPLPDLLLPMLAVPSEYPADAAKYAFEIKWDGIRALAYVGEREFRLRSRNLVDITDQYPELADLKDRLRGHQAVVDGEIVAFDARGYPSFQQLQARLGVSQREAARQRAGETPVVYVAFDLLHFDGEDVTGLPYEDRRALLESLDLASPHVQVSPAFVGDGKALLATPGFEGVVAKRLGSAYDRGARSSAWLKVKTTRRQELVIGGWSRGKGARRGKIGALLVGVYEAPPGDAPRKLLFAGSVGTGFTDRLLDELQEALAPHARESSPFAGPVDKKGVVFVEPRLVCEVEFTEWTRDGRLRHPSFKGLRDDKDPKEVVKEDA